MRTLPTRGLVRGSASAELQAAERSWIVTPEATVTAEACANEFDARHAEAAQLREPHALGHEYGIQLPSIPLPVQEP